MGRNTEKVDATLARAAASNYWTEAEAQAVLEAYEASGLSVAEFARRHGLVPQRRYRPTWQAGRTSDPLGRWRWGRKARPRLLHPCSKPRTGPAVCP